MPHISSFAKINLGLEVLRKRDDGFHDINTIFARISLSDAITIETDNQLQCFCAPQLGITQEQNLAYKAVEQYNKAFPNTEAAKITIRKHIPNGAGLGGGSSNAAYVLRSLCKRDGIEPTSPKILEIATKLGSDVPYFLDDGVAVATSKGEELSYFTCSIPYHVLLVFPALHVSTPWAYSQLHVHPEGKSAKPLRDILLMGISDPLHLREYCSNDFEKPVFGHFPRLAEIKKSLYDTGAVFALMSGSGSSVYGLFTTQAEALKAACTFSQEQTYVCTFV